MQLYWDKLLKPIKNRMKPISSIIVVPMILKQLCCYMIWAIPCLDIWVSKLLGIA